MSLLSRKTAHRLSNVNVPVCYSWFIDNRLKDGKTKTLTELKVKVSECARGHDLSLEQKTKAMKARNKNVVARTFHGAGIVVPVDQTGVGYRPLPETTGRRLSKLNHSCSGQLHEIQVAVFLVYQSSILYIKNVYVQECY